jgi:HJR/Mrr/RecB family endonuclease
MSTELHDVLAAEKAAADALAICHARRVFSVTALEITDLNARVIQNWAEIESRFGNRLSRALVELKFVAISLRIVCDHVLRPIRLPLFIPSLFVCVMGLGVALSLGALFRLGIPNTVVFGLLSGILVGCGFYAFVRFLPFEEAISSQIHVLKRRKEFCDENARHRALLSQQKLLSQLVALRKSYEAKAKAAVDIRGRFESVQNRLACVNWRALRGIEFEQFLVRVFEHLGYTVSTTKVSGDQGIDLIAVRSTVKLGIQAKGYCSSVGNDAVQQAHAGKSHYRCTHSVVITNSVFTRAAKELAQSVGCYLIDEDSMTDLIAGRLFCFDQVTGTRTATV